MPRPPRIPQRKQASYPQALPLRQVAQLFDKGLALHQQGQLVQAQVIYEQVLEIQPKHFDALHMLGVIVYQRKNPCLAVELISKALEINSSSAPAHSNRGLALQDLKRLDEAVASYDRAIALKPDYAEAYSNRGNALKDLKRLDEAVASYDRAIALKPDFAEAYSNRGLALQDLKRLDEAVASYDRAIALNPDYAEAYSNRGNALKDLKRLDEAVASYDRAIALKPDFAEAYSNRGLALQDLKRLDEAVASYDRAIALNPDYAEAYSNRGNALKDLKRLDEAVASYDRAIALKLDLAEAYSNRGNALKDLKRLDEAVASYDRAIALKPDFAEAYSNRGLALQDLKRLDEAVASYDRAIALKPDYAEAYSNRGNALKDLKRLDEAVASYDRAIALKPDFAEAYSNRGNALKDLKRLDEALTSYVEAIRIKPDLDVIRGDLIFLCNRLCHWDELEEIRHEIVEGLFADSAVSSPFPILSLIDDPDLHLKASRIWMGDKCRTSGALGEISPSKGPTRKIHIAYLSADFYGHATSYLMAELFELHDRSRFELTAISFGPEKRDAMRERVRSTFDRFEEVSGRSDLDVARFCREIGVDIAVDLKGYTQDSRTGIFAERCAPIQINWLGYPGTMAASFIDYIIADPVLIREEDLVYYTEKVIWLPDTYQVNDRKRKISNKTFLRKDLGLPEKAFVLCCFNNNYKILPEIFDVWMRILKRLTGSVLWLFEDNPTAAANLKKEAAARGVEPSRLIFAERRSLEEHLARHRLADLFIDSWPYNAHTTASDALWAGLPLVTRSGRSFVSRVAASLLKAVGLEELITQSDAEYEELIISLAQSPESLQALRKRLAQNRLSYPLFDSERFTRHLETAYSQIMERHWEGKPPDHLLIEPVTSLGEVSSTQKLANEDLKATENLENKAMNPQSNSLITTRSTFEHLLGLQTRFELLDIGVAWINEVPKYKGLIDRGLAHLHAVEGDERQIEKLNEVYGPRATVYPIFLFDGEKQTVYVTAEASGMTSLFPPKTQAQQFFNGFEQFGQVQKTSVIQTKRLDDVSEIPAVDFLKMDVQGAELTVLKNGARVLEQCVAIQLEVSFIPLYESQPTFGEIDVWMRSKGFVPHSFLDVKRWSIAPTTRNNDIRIPFNQLLEADIVYIKNPLQLSEWSDEQLRKLALIAHEFFSSPDLTIFLLIELERRANTQGQQLSLKDKYVAALNAPKAG